MKRAQGHRQKCQTERYTDEDSSGESFAHVDVDVAFGAGCEEIKFFIDNASIFKMVHFHAKSRELFLSFADMYVMGI